MKRPIEKILQDVLDLMGSFGYTQNEDKSSNSFFEAELNEDGFFILREEIRDYLIGAKNTEQQVQPDNSPKMCEECGKYPADLPSNLCCGCDAYRDHLS